MAHLVVERRENMGCTKRVVVAPPSYRRFALAAAGVWVAVVWASAAPRAGAESFLVNTYASPSSLYRVDVPADTATLIGSTGVSYMTDIGRSPLDGQLYAITSNTLFSVDVGSGHATTIGALGISDAMVGLCVQPDGTCIGVDQNSNASLTGLYRINPTTGAATLLFHPGYSFAGDVAYAGPGQFYASSDAAGGSHLIFLNANTDTATDLGVVAANQGIWGLSFDAQGVLFAFSSNGNVYTIPNFASSGTGVFDFSLSLPGQIGGVTFLAPEPSTFAIFGVGAIGIAACGRRAQRRTGLPMPGE
jgi:hypothetical protein